MQSALIHFEPVFTKWEQNIFIKKAFKKVKSTIMINEKEIPVYKMPVFMEKPSKKMMQRFISYLKEENIEYVLLSESAASLSVSYILKNHFKLFTGGSVINYKLYEILKKCAESRNKELSDSSVVLITESLENAKEFIMKIYKHVKKIKIKTDKPTIFSDLTSFFMYEYGLFIEISRKTEKKENEIYILLDGLYKSADLYVNGDDKTEILFSAKNLFKELTPYVKLNQYTLEFLIHQLSGNLSQQGIKSFFKMYSVRVIKLIK